MHEGKINNDDWLPYFSSKASGDVLIDISQKNPEVDFLILCGHTHSTARYQPTANLVVEVGKAEYKRPEIQKIISMI